MALNQLRSSCGAARLPIHQGHPQPPYASVQWHDDVSRMGGPKELRQVALVAEERFGVAAAALCVAAAQVAMAALGGAEGS